MPSETTPEPFFIRDGEAFRPTRWCRGPWSETSLHGRVAIGLLGAEIERRHGAEGFIPARLTVDMYRLADVGDPLTVETRLVRDGARIKVVEAECFSAGVSIARASAQLLRRTGAPEGAVVWSPPAWDAPGPDQVPPPTDPRAGMGGMWEMRMVQGGFGVTGRKRCWVREVRGVADGAPMTAFSRVAMACDLASPLSNSGSGGLAYINSDVTLYLARLPVSEWVGFDVVNHQAEAGVAIGECWLYDEAGAIGLAACCALTQRRPVS